MYWAGAAWFVCGTGWVYRRLVYTRSTEDVTAFEYLIFQTVVESGPHGQMTTSVFVSRS